MWIRSQDKTALINCEYILLHRAFGITYDVLINKVPMGNYSTKEKALRVIDEIQEMIDQQEEYKAQGENRNEGTKRLLKFVYQMPSDEQIVVLKIGDNTEVKDND